MKVNRKNKKLLMKKLIGVSTTTLMSFVVKIHRKYVAQLSETH